ncbi:MAG: EAL domain-containing protein [Arenimonas sp.]
MRPVQMLASAILMGLSLAVAPCRANETIPTQSTQAAVDSAGEPTFESIGIAQGLTSSTLFGVFVDRHGFVWFWGDGGLHRYDGLHMQTFDRKPGQTGSLGSRRNAALAETSDAIWVLSPSGVLQRLDAKTGVFSQYPLINKDGRRPGAGLRLLADPRDRLWIGTDIGLFRLDPGMSAPVAVELPGGGDTWITALALSVDSRQLMIGSAARVFTIDLDKPSHSKLKFVLPTDEPTVVIVIAPWRRLLWLATSHGLFRHDLDSGMTERVALPDGLAYERISELVVSGDGTLWFGGVQPDGLVRFDPKNHRAVVYRHHPDDPHSLKSDRVGALALDRRENLWIGLLREGANRLRVTQRGNERYLAPPGRSNSFCAMSELPDGRLLVALCGGSVGILDTRTGKFEDRAADLNRALPSPTPTLNSHAIVSDGRGGYWLPASFLGLVHWQPGTGRATLHQLRASDGNIVPPPYLSDVLVDRNGVLWVGTRRGLAMMTQKEQSLRLLNAAVQPGDLFASGVNAIAEARDGRLLVGTAHGLVRLDPNTKHGERHVHDVDDSTTLSDDMVLCIYTDHAGTTWVGTQAGLNRVVSDAEGKLRFRRYGVAEGLPDQSIYSIVMDASGTLWTGTSRGIASYEVERDRFRAFLPTDGVPDSSINKQSVLSASDGSLYFGTFAGLLRVHPNLIDTAEPLPLMLSSYELGGTTHVNLRGSEVDALSTSYTQARVRFKVAAFGDNRRLSYRLSGLESQWQDLPSSLAVGYDPLPPGTYRFEVRQMGRDGKWLPASVLVPLQVLPPPWRSNLAYALYAGTILIALTLLSIAYRQRRARALRHVAELSRLANYDILTSLPNRTRFNEDLARALDDSPSTPLALFFIDLDRFKNINDSLGHGFGDQVLVAAGQRLSEALPKSGELARLGGDEFTIILPQIKYEADAAAIAKDLLAAFATPLHVAGSDVVVTLSIGISLSPMHASDGATLIQYADSAMYYAKNAGRNTYCFFRPEMTAQVSRRLVLETSLRNALESNEFYPVFQPKKDMATGQISGAEVLLRWQSAELGNVTPVEFIPILEDTGMIGPVGLWLIQRVCEHMQTWRQQELPQLPMAINISVHQLIRGDLCDQLAELTSKFGIPTDSLELEITETAIMENSGQMDAALHELSSLGLGLSIDDFGTGYSSFAHLSHLPVNKLKIDKAFVDGIGINERADTLCAAIIAMAHNLKLSVVAEGVETEMQHNQLLAMGCDEAQGYWYSMPLRVHEFEQYMRTQALTKTSVSSSKD